MHSKLSPEITHIMKIKSEATDMYSDKHRAQITAD